MSTVIDSLLVLLSLDPSGFRKGAKDADEAMKGTRDNSDKYAKDMEAKGKQAAQFFGQIRNQVIALAATFTAGAGLKSFLTEMTGADASAGRTARNIGVATETLTAWQGVAERAGGTAAGITSSMQGLSQQFQQLALTGQSAVVPYFRAVGVSMADANGKLRPMSDILLDLSDKFSKMDPARAQALGRGMGIDEGTINVLMQGRAAIQALLIEQEKLGRANEQDAKAAAQRQKDFNALGQASADLGRKLLTALTPALTAVLHGLTAMAEWFAEHPNVFKIFAGTIIAAATLLGVALNVLAFKGFMSLVASLFAVPPAAAAASAAMTGTAAAANAATASVGTGILGMMGALAKSAGLVAAAGAVGYVIGTAIYAAIEDTKFADRLGHYIAKTLAFFGNADAQAALDAEEHSKGNSTGGTTASWTDSNRPMSNRARAANLSAPAEVAAAAKGAEAKYGVPAEVTVAQWKLESDSGKHMPAGSNNPFGIKARAGQPYVEAQTKEFIDGQMRTVTQKFAKFDTLADAFEAHAKLLATGSAYTEARKHTADPAAYADALTGHYATDPQYGAKLKALMNPYAPDPALRGGATAAAVAANNTTSNVSTNSSHAETHIGEVNVVLPNATDSASVAKGLSSEMKNNFSIAAQANNGLV